MTKNEIRQLARTLRSRAARLPIEEIAAAAAAFLTNVRKLPAWHEVRRPCIYVSLPGEAPTAAILEDFFRRGFAALVPRVNGDVLELCEIRDKASLVSGAFGILEPSRKLPAVAPETADCVLVPGVAFDADGGRVGHGRGFYDRLLAHIPDVLRVALAWEWQLLPEVPVAAHDVRMDWIATPERLLRCPHSRLLL
jgi:5-formyltetrahydrofolate cyclo-ligase